MTKYQELCEKLEKTKHTLEVLESKFEEIFVPKLSEYLECDPNLISLNKMPPHFSKHPGIISQVFSLGITLESETPGYGEIITLPSSFSWHAPLEAKENGYTFLIKYKECSCKLEGDETITELFDIVFEDLQQDLMK